jgi:pentose-5-phosphate-3-epimerase
LSFLIEVDGGVSDKTLAYLTEADALVAGSYIFKNDYAKAIASLKS